MVSAWAVATRSRTAQTQVSPHPWLLTSLTNSLCVLGLHAGCAQLGPLSLPAVRQALARAGKGNSPNWPLWSLPHVLVIMPRLPSLVTHVVCSDQQNLEWGFWGWSSYHTYWATLSSSSRVMWLLPPPVLLGCSPMEYSHHVFKKLRPHEEAANAFNQGLTQ